MRSVVPSSIRSRLILLGFLAFLPVLLLMLYNFRYQGASVLSLAMLAYFAGVWYVGNGMAAEIERRRAESARMQEELRAAAIDAENQQARTEAIVAGIGDGINIVDRDFRVLYQNRQHEALMGGAHAGESCYKAYHGRDERCENCVVDLSFRTGRIHRGECEGTREDRTSFLEVTASPLRDASGEIVAGIEVVRDVTERKRSERHLGRSVRMLSALRAVDLKILRGAEIEDTLGGVCDAIVRLGYPLCWVGLAMRDHASRVVAARGPGMGIVGSLDVRWDESPKGQGAFGEVIRRGRTFVCGDLLEDDRFLPWRDRYVDYGLRSLACLPLKSDDGAVVGALMVYGGEPNAFPREDVSDLETFAQQSAVAILSAKWIENLREANQRLMYHVDKLPLGYILWDMDFRIVEWNPAAERIFGWREEETSGRNAMDLLVPEEGKRDIACVRERLVAGEEVHSVNVNVRKDGVKVWCEWFNGPLQDAGGKVTGVLSIVHDVTEKVYLEKQLQAAQRMEAVGTLAGGIAHDFNNALTGVFGFGQMLRPYLKGNEKAVSHLDEVMRSAERAATLTRQLLAYSRRQPVSLSNVDLNDLVRDLSKLLAKVAGERVEVRLSLAERLPAIHADAGQVEQVIMNLVINSKDAMPAGGVLSVETSVAALDEGHVRFHPQMRVGEFVVLTVSDTGIGMDAETRDRVFEPFFTTKGPSKGTGLGLAMVYGIVRQHNGFIHLYSAPGQGTNFRVYLPPVSGTPDAAPAGKPFDVRGGTETILVAEDDGQVRLLVEDTLRELGYTVLSAGNGREAVALFTQHREEISLAVLDVAMPEMGGKEAYEAIHGISPGLKVLFMSGYAVDGEGETFLLVSGVPFLPKPFGPAVLGRKVRAVLDGK